MSEDAARLPDLSHRDRELIAALVLEGLRPQLRNILEYTAQGTAGTPQPSADLRLLRELIGSQTSQFLTAEQIRELAREEAEAALGRIDLACDEDHIDRTKEAMSTWVKWHGRFDKTATVVYGGLLLYVFHAAAKALGFNLPHFGGGE